VAPFSTRSRIPNYLVILYHTNSFLGPHIQILLRQAKSIILQPLVRVVTSTIRPKMSCAQPAIKLGLIALRTVCLAFLVPLFARFLHRVNCLYSGPPDEVKGNLLFLFLSFPSGLGGGHSYCSHGYGQ